jgi:hypothetical protein
VAKVMQASSDTQALMELVFLRLLEPYDHRHSVYYLALNTGVFPAEFSYHHQSLLKFRTTNTPFCNSIRTLLPANIPYDHHSLLQFSTTTTPC